jgi:hypothetical protein
MLEDMDMASYIYSPAHIPSHTQANVPLTPKDILDYPALKHVHTLTHTHTHTHSLTHSFIHFSYLPNLKAARKEQGESLDTV